MVCKTINRSSIKKSTGTLIGVIITILIVMGIFFAGFSYLKSQTDASGVTIPTKYNDSFTRLEITQETIDDNVNKTQKNIEGIVEAETAFQVAWNGLKGLGNTLKLSVNFVSASIDTTSAFLIPLDVIPPKIKSLLFIGLTAFMIFLILSILKGDPKLT